VDVMNEAGVPAGEINDIGQVFRDPQVRHLGLAQPVRSHERGDISLIGQPILMSRTPSRIAAPPPLAGEHTEGILADLGYSAADIAALRDAGAI
jgi:crotonobetainyl-CoA:carnitine CoA-transferase CaiB-like acyl-CoA transferase